MTTTRYGLSNSSRERVAPAETGQSTAESARRARRWPGCRLSSRRAPCACSTRPTGMASNPLAHIAFPIGLPRNCVRHVRYTQRHQTPWRHTEVDSMRQFQTVRRTDGQLSSATATRWSVGRIGDCTAWLTTLRRPATPTGRGHVPTAGHPPATSEQLWLPVARQVRAVTGRAHGIRGGPTISIPCRAATSLSRAGSGVAPTAALASIMKSAKPGPWCSVR
jgi:hypothetical protein